MVVIEGLCANLVGSHYFLYQEFQEQKDATSIDDKQGITVQYNECGATVQIGNIQYGVYSAVRFNTLRNGTGTGIVVKSAVL